MDDTSKLYSQAFKRWKASLNKFQHALKSFLEECAQLDSMFQRPVAHGRREREKTLARLDTALTHSEVWVSDFRSACVTLGTLRNRCNTLAPINKLPVETLTRILSLVDTDCIFDSLDDLFIEFCPEMRLFSVLGASRRLRQVATSAHGLWTHVDLVIGGEYQEEFMHDARTCLKYSGQRDLHVHITEVEDDEDRCSTDIIKLLEPHRSRISTLNIQAVNPHASDIVLGLFSDVSTCHMTKFYLNGHTVDWRVPGEYDTFFDGRLDSLWSSLKALSIIGPTPPLRHPSHPVFRGLTVLSVFGFSDHQLTTSQLRDALACCPELRALSLISFRLQSGVEAQPEHVLLPNLEVLDLRMTVWDNVLDILSFIHPKSHELALSLEPDGLKEAMAIKIRGYIERLKVTKLLFDTDLFSRNDILSVLLESEFPTIRELAFYSFIAQELVDIKVLDRARFPSLHAIHMLNCRLDTEHVEQLFESSAAQVVYSDSGGYPGPGFGDFSWFRYRYYPHICRGDDEVEWPVKLKI